jgi:hypothetical protein
MTNKEREIIISYQQELYTEAQETQELFGVQDEAAKRLYSQWYVIGELLEKLEAQ